MQALARTFCSLGPSCSNSGIINVVAHGVRGEINGSLRQLSWLVSSSQPSTSGPSDVPCASMQHACSRENCAPSSSNPWQQLAGAVRTLHSTSAVSAIHVSTSAPKPSHGAPRPTPWPVFEKVQATTGGQLKHRGVVRFPPEVEVSQHGDKLLLSGQAGSVKLDLSQLDPSGLMAYKLLTAPSPEGKSRSVMLLASPNKERYEQINGVLSSNIQGVMQGYLVGLTVQGVGYRLQPVEEPVTATKWFFERTNYEKSNITYPYTKPATAIRLKVGFSRTIIYPLPADVRAFCIRPNLLYLYGLQEDRLQAIAQDIRSIRKPNVYTGNGIQLQGEVVNKKQRSGRKAK